MFGHLRYTDKLPLKINNIHQAGKDVKAVIRKLELLSDIDIGQDEDNFVVFRFLETLPNLQVLTVMHLRTAHLSEFVSSIRHTALLELVLQFGISVEPIVGPPTVGLAGLKKLAIRWRAYDNPMEPPGYSPAHLYEFIRPTLTTLVELVIDNDQLPYVIDLHLLKPAADTLRTFEYSLQGDDESILDTIPDILPHLTNLSIKCLDLFKRRSILWKDTHIQALSKNNNLTDLCLSSYFEQDGLVFDRSDYDGLVRCYERRLKATQDIASACPRLQRCSWCQLAAKYWHKVERFHPFIVEEQFGAPVMGGNDVTRVVRGVKQMWMGRDYKDLPGDIIDQKVVVHTPKKW